MKNQIIEIPDSIIAQFEALPSAVNREGFTTQQDELLLKYWPIKRHSDVAKLIGFSTNTCIKRYRILINK